MSHITDKDRNAFHGVNPSTSSAQPSQEVVVEPSNDTALNIAKVFFYMFAGLLITALVAFGVGAIVYYNVVVLESENMTTIYLGMVIGAAIALIIDMIVINVVLLKGKHSILVPGIIYAVLVGIMFSMLTIVIDWRLIGMAFGITAVSFALMGLIAFLTKGNLSPILIIIMGLAIGAGLLALFNWIYALATGTVIETIWWVLQFAILALVMFVSLFDMWRIKKIAEAGAMNNNIALYCAFTIYTDFINVFIRILYFLVLIFGRRK